MAPDLLTDSLSTGVPVEEEAATYCLADKSCVPCAGGVPPLTAREIAPMAAELSEYWTVIDNHHLEAQFEFADFAAALAATNKLGAIAEEQWHHPDLLVAWGKLGVTLWTHKIDGLSEADFVLAAKFDRALTG
jgi:4a-hydroxytetrahydrobiopterin dehydratase